jgi:hypothetical protein
MNVAALAHEKQGNSETALYGFDLGAEHKFIVGIICEIESAAGFRIVEKSDGDWSFGHDQSQLGSPKFAALVSSPLNQV